MTRYFASAALRPGEEVSADVAAWLPQLATVSFDEAGPRAGVWRSATGVTRVCWYRGAANIERAWVGDATDWLLDVTRADAGLVEVREILGGVPAADRTVWRFDDARMPIGEERFGADGRLVLRREFECTIEGVVHARATALPPAFVMTQEWRDTSSPWVAPCPELMGEAFPCGGHVGPARVVAVVNQNSHQGRYLVVVPTNGGLVAGIASLGTMKVNISARGQRVLNYQGQMTMAELTRGALDDARQEGYRMHGVVEALPDGEPLDALVRRGTLAAAAAVLLAQQVGQAARAARAAGVPLAAIRPELVYVRAGAAGPEVSGILHRAPAVFAETYAGEAIVWPPVFPMDFSSRDDVAGLAQLLWYLTSGTHPELAPENLCWDPSWDGFRHQLRARQPWTGPAELGPLLARGLWGTPPPALDAFLAELDAVAAGLDG
ncbi:MAG: hypothetical protein R3B06_14375 [Kofleriaceae bacterium]